MRTNSLKALLKADQPAINGWLSIGSSYTAEVMAHCGFDSITVDMQHGMTDFATAIAMLQAISTTAATPLVRPTGSSAVEIMRVLDAGAYGVICPQVDTADIARTVVAACKYPPMGTRSHGPRRGVLYGGPDYHHHANEEIMVFVMIESRTAVANLDEILSVQGIDGVFIGPNDLGMSYGGGVGCEPQGEVADVIETIRRKTVERGLIAGIFCTDGDMCKRRIAQGFRFVNPGSDVAVLKGGAETQVKKSRQQ